MPTDPIDATRTVTIAELAELRGTTRKAARALVSRRRWPKRPGNDGALRVTVPMAELEPQGAPASAPQDVPEAVPQVSPGEALAVSLARAEAALEAERDRSAELRGLAAELRGDRDRWAELAQTLRADLHAERSRGFLARILGRAA